MEVVLIYKDTAPRNTQQEQERFTRWKIKLHIWWQNIIIACSENCLMQVPRLASPFFRLNNNVHLLSSAVCNRKMNWFEHARI